MAHAKRVSLPFAIEQADQPAVPISTYTGIEINMHRYIHSTYMRMGYICAQHYPRAKRGETGRGGNRSCDMMATELKEILSLRNALFNFELLGLMHLHHVWALVRGWWCVSVLGSTSKSIHTRGLCL